MTPNFNDLTYTIIGFDSTQNPIVRFGCDGSTQHLANCPTDTADNAKAYLDSYVVAYIAGLQQVANVVTANAVDPSVQALVGQSQTASAEA